MDADFVISFTYAKEESRDTVFRQLVKRLSSVGLQIEARNGEEGSILVFVKCLEERLQLESYRERTQDWLQGSRLAAPEVETATSLHREPLTDAERLRLVHLILTAPTYDGGAGLTPGLNEWKLVKSIFPIHNTQFNKRWIFEWAKQWSVSDDQLTVIHNHFGSKTAYYFAFTQFYYKSLIFPTIAGASAYYLLPEFSPLYAVLLCGWTVQFCQSWQRREKDLAVKWGVRGCGLRQRKRAAFKGDRQITNSMSGELSPYFPAWKRAIRQGLALPFIFIAAISLAAILSGIFATEVFMGEVYNGPGKKYLLYLPTVLFTLLVPSFTAIYAAIAERLTSYENHEYESKHESSMIQKMFVLNFLASYMALFLAAYVYIPFGHLLVPQIDVFALSSFGDKDAPPQSFAINPNRLRNQLFYMTVTAQVINFGVETILPYLQQKASSGSKQLKMRFRNSRGASEIFNDKDEASFLQRVRTEANMAEYDVQNDFREMVIQFGYSAMFSVVWPLTPLTAFVNNWIELRSDALKICIEMKRPIPIRTDSIGPWKEYVCLSFD